MSDEERNLEHKRAEYAFECITEITGWDKNEQEKNAQKKYRSTALSCSALIQKSGLMQVMAFYLSKTEPQKKLAEHILRWVIYQRHNGNAVELFNLLITSNDVLLMQMTMEAQAIAKWLKRFAEGRLEKDGNARVATDTEESEEKTTEQVTIEG